MRQFPEGALKTVLNDKKDSHLCPHRHAHWLTASLSSLTPAPGIYQRLLSKSHISSHHKKSHWHVSLQGCLSTLEEGKTEIS